jgi:hypothetical protein
MVVSYRRAARIILRSSRKSVEIGSCFGHVQPAFTALRNVTSIRSKLRLSLGPYEKRVK